jgi:hypothetical protein
MQGFNFLILGEKGPINHGVVVERLTADKYLCQFAKTPTSCRVVSLDEIQQWNLFPDTASMNAFIVELQKKKLPGTEAKKKVSKKKAKKKVRKQKPSE